MSRRGRGEGSIYQRHDHESCPPAGADGGRPDHRCRGRWVSVLDLGMKAGKRNRKTLYGATRKEVVIKLARAEQTRTEGGSLAAAPTFAEWGQYFLEVVCEERGLRHTTIESYKNVLNIRILPELGNVRLDALTPEHPRAVYRAMQEAGLAPAYVRLAHNVMHRMLRVAMRERRITYNVCEMIDPPKMEKRGRLPISAENASRIIDDGALRWVVAVALGLRQGEALALRWADVDFANGVLWVRRTLSRKLGTGLVFGPPKSAAGLRAVPLTGEILAVFKRWYVSAGSPVDSALVFPNRLGNPRDPKTDRMAWTRYLESMKIPHAPLHAARNTAATMLSEAGVPAKQVMQILGQSSVDVTLGYQHSDVDALRTAMDRQRDYIDGSRPKDGSIESTLSFLDSGDEDAGHLRDE